MLADEVRIIQQTNWWTFAIAMVGAVTGVVALGWQIYLRTTDRPRLKATAGVFGLTSMTGPIPDTDLVCAYVTNHGRRAAYIDNLLVTVGKRKPYVEWRRFDRIHTRVAKVLRRTDPKKRIVGMMLKHGPLSDEVRSMNPEYPIILDPHQRRSLTLVRLTDEARQVIAAQDGVIWCLIHAPNAGVAVSVKIKEKDEAAT